MTPLGPEIITQIGGFKITNTLITTLVTDVVLVSLAFYVSKNAKLIPGKFQSIIETGVSYFYDLTSQLTGREKETKAIFPWVMSFFLVIFVTNILGLLPGVGSIGFFPKTEHAATEQNAGEHAITTEETTTEVQQGKTDTEHAPAETEHAPVESEHATEESKPIAEETVNKESAAAKPQEETAHESEFLPLLRPATSDFNATLALAFISLIATHALSIRYTGLKDYLMRFFSLNPILLFVGILELVSEFIKMISLSFRLYGNIFAGEVALHTVSTLHPFSAFLAPIPFLLLESIVAIVQALVFAMLTMVFMSIMITPHHTEH